jgi:hypothetical protein
MEYGYANGCSSGKCSDFSPPLETADTTVSTMTAGNTAFSTTPADYPGSPSNDLDGPPFGTLSLEVFNSALSLPGTYGIINGVDIHVDLAYLDTNFLSNAAIEAAIAEGDYLFIFGSANAIPEPSTMSLLVVGGLFLVVGVIVRRKAHSVR